MSIPQTKTEAAVSQCKQCGQCCRTIVHLWTMDQMRKARNKKIFTKKEYGFIKKHWTRIGKPKKMNSLIPIQVWNRGVFYKCDLVGADGKCTDYENRIRICKDYPRLTKDGSVDVFDLITENCGFMPRGV